MSPVMAPGRALPLFRDSNLKLTPAGVRRVAPPTDGGRLTLEQQLDRVWEGLTAAGAAECPMCRGRMHAATGGAPASCDDCGTSLE